MTDTLLTVLVPLAAVLAFVMAGIYFAFSGFIMRSLNAIGYQEAISAMNSINKEILRSSFMLLFFGSSLVAFLILLATVFLDDVPFPEVLATGSLFYLIGLFGCTAVFNEPLNNRLLEAVDSEKNLEHEWDHYYRKWTHWNHVRTVCCVMSGLLYIWAANGVL